MSALAAPWVGRFNNSGGVTIYGGPALLPICHLYVDPGRPERLRAHKAMIEATPDLLAALKAWRDAASPACFDDAVQLREAAIAKAEGRA